MTASLFSANAPITAEELEFAILNKAWNTEAGIIQLG
jgi:hypothetical protein